MNWVCWVLIQGCHSAGIPLVVSRHQTVCLQAKPTHTHTPEVPQRSIAVIQQLFDHNFRLEFVPLQRRRALSAWWWKGWMTSTNGFSNIVTCDSVHKEVGFWPLPASVHYQTQSGSEKRRDHSGRRSRLLWWWRCHIYAWYNTKLPVCEATVLPNVAMNWFEQCSKPWLADDEFLDYTTMGLQLQW